MNPPSLPDAKTIVELSWIGLLALGILGAGFSAMGVAAFLRSPNSASSFSKMFERLQILKMATVLLVVIATAYLGLFGIIESTGVVGIFSGVAGYVLGGLERKTADAPAPKPAASKDQDKQGALPP